MCVFVCMGRDGGEVCRFLQNYYYDFYGGNRIVFITIQTTLIQSNITKVYFNSFGYIYMCATCFDMYRGHPQAWQYKNLKKNIH